MGSRSTASCVRLVRNMCAVERQSPAARNIVNDSLRVLVRLKFDA
jgi:hypothetical protein